MKRISRSGPVSFYLFLLLFIHVPSFVLHRSGSGSMKPTFWVVILEKGWPSFLRGASYTPSSSSPDPPASVTLAPFYCSQSPIPRRLCTRPQQGSWAWGCFCGSDTFPTGHRIFLSWTETAATAWISRLYCWMQVLRTLQWFVFLAFIELWLTNLFLCFSLPLWAVSSHGRLKKGSCGLLE